MRLFDSSHPEIAQALDLFSSMGGRLSSRGRSEHCRAIAKSIYGLANRRYWNGLNVTVGRVGLAEVSVDLHVRFAHRSVLPRDDYDFVLILYWVDGQGLLEVFNGSTEEFGRLFGERSVSFERLLRNEVRPDLALHAFVPEIDSEFDEMPSPEEPGEGDGGRGDDGGGGGPGGGGGGGRRDGDNGNGPPNGRGGMSEVVAHPVLFSVDREYYNFLLENY